ncbi:MAG: class I SAM-dependent methyltransferase [Firmicutes bacterium]|nr:class I SAM-dependent methyltransferase [Bacillota bacterium]
MSEHQEDVRKQFGPSAAAYRDAPLFAQGSDLQKLIATARLSGNERVLDLGTGAGHTALAFAGEVREVIGIDVTPEMIQTARALAQERGVTNVDFQVADAAQLPFPENCFDRVTCRMAMHHFPHLEQVLHEVARVLVPGGQLLVVDHYAPDEDELDDFINAIERLRDPSHIREYRIAEWQSAFAMAGLTFAVCDRWDLPLLVGEWVARSRTPKAQCEVIMIRMRMASQNCRETFQIEFDNNGVPLSFCLKTALFQGMKQAAD